MRTIYMGLFLALLGTTAQADLEKTEMIYMNSCIACHGADGSGVMPGVKDLADPNGALIKKDEELIRAIRYGVRAARGGIAMPPNGGNPNLTDADIRSLISYLRAVFGREANTTTPHTGEKK